MTVLPEWLTQNEARPPDLRFYGADVLGPIVYLVERDGHPLYVGASLKGLARPLGRHHALVDRLPSDTFYVWRFPDSISAIAFETHLIARLSPERNGQGINAGGTVDWRLEMRGGLLE